MYLTSIPRIEPQTCVQLSQLVNGLFPSLKSLELQFNTYHNNIELSVLPFLLRSNQLSAVTYHAERYDELSGVLSILVEQVIFHCRCRKARSKFLQLLGRLEHEHISTLSHFSQLRSITLMLDMVS